MFPGITPDSVSQLVLSGVRMIFLLGFLFYVVFAFIALRQIETMRKTVSTPFSSTVLLIGVAHLILAIGALVFAFFTLA